MNIHERLLNFVTWANWIILLIAGTVSIFLSPLNFATGIISGGLLVTINFHLLHRTLKKALKPPHLTNFRTVLAKYYIRFVISSIIIFLLISGHVVNPLGLIIGLSVVVASIMLATIVECKNLFMKEAM